MTEQTQEQKVDQLVEQYRALREKKAELKKNYEAAAKQFDRAMKDIEAQLLQLMQTLGVKTLRTEAGTAYTTERVNYAISDADSFYNFIKQTGRVDMLQRRPAKAAIEEFVSATDQLPPGLSRHAELVVNIRK